MTARIPPYWPHAHQTMLDDLPPHHWFVINHARLVREPTRRELESPYIPLDILEDPLEARRQRLATVLRYLGREAEKDDVGIHAYNVAQLVDTHNGAQVVHNGPNHDGLDGLADDPGTDASVNHVERDREQEQGKCSSYMSVKGYIRTHDSAAFPDVEPMPHVWPSAPELSVPTVRHTRRDDTTQSGNVSASTDNSNVLVVPSQPRIRRLRIAINQDQRTLTSPTTAEEKTHLIFLFREEVLHNHVNSSKPVRVSAHDIRMREVKQAIRNSGMLGDKPYLLASNITRHDWHHRTGVCIYTVNLKNGPKSGSGEHLAEHYAGVEHTLWEYWGSRNRIRHHHVRRFINLYDPQTFYQTIMWQHLPTREWIGLWQQLRDSGRV
jgi:hypothetical protein